MNAKQLFFERYHGYKEYPEHLLKDLTEIQIRNSPHPAVNPIAWVIWHLARCEDVCVNRVLSDGRQVLDDNGRSERLRVSDRSTGTGMSKPSVFQLSAEIDLAELEAYRVGVMNRTETALESISSHELAHDLNLERLQQVFITEQAGGPHAEQVVEAYRGHTQGWLLGHLVLTHHYYHIGQAFGVRAMHGAASPW